MFTQKIIDSDAFLDMPLSTQALYFHLNMRADDDGFINNPKRIQRTVGASEDDLKLLIAKRFVICFENGVIVIKHWRMHNTLKKDRYNPTQYQEQLALLDVKANKAYTEKEYLPIDNQLEPIRNHNGTIMEPQYSIDKYSIDKVSIVENNAPDSDESEPEPVKKTKKTKTIKNAHGEYQNVLLTDNEYDNLANSFGVEVRDKAIKFLDEYIEEKGYKSKSHNLAIRRWVVEAVSKQPSNYKRTEIVPEWMNKKNSFTGFENQRQYDMDELEKQLLSKNKPEAHDDP